MKRAIELITVATVVATIAAYATKDIHVGP